MSGFTGFISRWALRNRQQRALSALAGSPWVAQPGQLHAAFDEIRTRAASEIRSAADVRAAQAQIERDPEVRTQFAIEDGIAIIPIHGLIMREVPCAFELFGIAATSTLDTTQMVRAALANDEVRGIFLDVDSPGGTLAGTADLADEIAAATEIKPVHAHASDLAASAAFWIASQASVFTAGQTAEIGSIGVFKVLVDSSAEAEEAGLVVHKFATGPLKGVGVAGVEITEAQQKNEQSMVDQAGEMFRAAVGRGRPHLSAEAIRGVATGAVFFGPTALERGLIDEVLTTEQAFNQLREVAGPALSASQETTTEPDEGSQRGDTMGMFKKDKGTGETSGLEEQLAEAEARAEAAEKRAAEAEEQQALLTAKNEMTELMLGKMKDDGFKSVLDKHQAAGRFDPAARPKMEEQAKKFDTPQDLDTFLGEFPATKNKTEAGGGLGSNNTPKPKGHFELSQEDKEALAKDLNVPVAHLEPLPGMMDDIANDGGAN